MRSNNKESHRLTTTCFISYEIHPTTMGGCGVLIHHAADVLLNQGHEVVLLLDVPEEIFRAFVDRDRLTFARPERLRAYRVDELCGDLGPTPAEVPDIFQWKSLRFAAALEVLERRERIDFVEFFEYCGPAYYAFARRLFEEPGVARPVLGCRLHGSIEVLERFGEGLARDRSQLSQFAFERASLALAEAVLAPTGTYYTQYYKPLYNILDGKTIVSSPPKQAFERAEGGPSTGRRFSIAFIGRLFHIKGVDQLVHAAVILMKERPDLDFTVDLVGYDSADTPFPGAGASYSNYLTTLIPERLRTRFHFHGQVSHDRIARLLDHALFAVFPNRIESFCYALHETYDAGVPVIINALPAFLDFFTHERNCLAYRGGTAELLACMRRMITDAPLRARLTRPYPVADHPIGDFYAAPARLSPISREPTTPARPLVAVLCGNKSDVLSSRAAASLRAQTFRDFRAVFLVPAPPDGEETLWWLGEPWHLRGATDEHIEASDVLTSDSFLALHATDSLDATWLERCAGALSRRDDAAFTGTWARHAGRLMPSSIDVLPELAPFDRPSLLHRVLLRTTPGQLLCDLFDTTLGPLGHTGTIWSAIGALGRGVMLPEALIDLERPDVLRPEARHLKSLVMRAGGPFAQTLALLAPILAEQLAGALSRAPAAPAPSVPPAPPTVEHKIRLADELGGRTLAKLVFKKLTRKVRGG